MILEPIFEADFSASSYGFRPQTGAHGAEREIYKYLNWGCLEVYDVDLEKYFDTVAHSKLLKLLARRVADQQILHVIKQWLSSGYVEEGQHRQSRKGTPQGGVISPLLANIYLNPVDQAYERQRLETIRQGSIHMIRYADVMIILAQKNIDKGIGLLHHYVERLGLRLNAEKTRRLRMETQAQAWNFWDFDSTIPRAGRMTSGWYWYRRVRGVRSDVEKRYARYCTTASRSE